MSVHGREDLERLSRFTRRKFGRALMSDTKWHKLFAAVEASDWIPSRVLVKFVDVEEPSDRTMRWPSQNAFWGPPQWIDTPEFGPIELRAIEWLVIPAFVVYGHSVSEIASATEPQDVEVIRSALSQVGQFPLEDVPEGLKVVGYA